MGIALQSILAVTSDLSRTRLHMLLTTYLGDLPEAEDLLAVKRKVQTERPCHNCLYVKERLSFASNAPPQGL